jgi:hypothetical protein
MVQSALKNIEDTIVPLSRNERPGNSKDNNPRDERIFINQLEGVLSDGVIPPPNQRREK